MRSDMDGDGWTCSQVCKLLGTSYWAVYNLHRRNAIPDTRWHGHARVYGREDVVRIAAVLKRPLPWGNAAARGDSA